MKKEVQVILNKVEAEVRNYAIALVEGRTPSKNIPEIKKEAIEEVASVLGIPNARKAKSIAKNIVNEFVDNLIADLQR